MRRFIALIIMFVVPLQFAWAASAGLHGHMGEHGAALGVHAHDHDHHAHGPSDHDASGETGKNHSEDGQHGSHCHHVFSFILQQRDSLSCLQLSNGPIQHAPAAFFTRIPPLLDRPPLARA